eukprot:CAMPEP_0185579684 /NCGR_PEP_ID=MMETSP0434-20130131/15351_1 /TAXON_ID=626734 ORGANISM="Favella taraikaensis, Strain Fe Narragansett Bay" /NCGR_SAMPLE_ID=MMETSP0434 /ASSEMBLY_ACC=CAM_ASM_000379 /LENGTH=151 /DNA_ID=CAMNT_0028197755 /DNA_START=45 /DNA_END=501 /DNA_ORIENTATION=+
MALAMFTLSNAVLLQGGDKRCPIGGCKDGECCQLVCNEEGRCKLVCEPCLAQSAVLSSSKSTEKKDDDKSKKEEEKKSDDDSEGSCKLVCDDEAAVSSANETPTDRVYNRSQKWSQERQVGLWATDRQPGTEASLKGDASYYSGSTSDQSV